MKTINGRYLKFAITGSKRVSNLILKCPSKWNNEPRTSRSIVLRASVV
jgi:hypothetical protein